MTARLVRSAGLRVPEVALVAALLLVAAALTQAGIPAAPVLRGLCGIGILLVVVWSVRTRDRETRHALIRDRALAAAPDGILIADAAAAGHPVVFLNPAFTRLTGWTSGELLGRPNPLPQPDGGGTLPDGPSEVEVTRRDGSAFLASVNAAAVRDERGRVSHHVWTLADLAPRLEAEAAAAARRRAEEALGETELHHRAMLDALPIGALSFDASGRIGYVNEALARIAGRTREQLLDRTVGAVLVHPDDPDLAAEHDALLREAMAAGRLPVHDDGEILTAAGATVSMSWNRTMRRGPDGSVTSVLALGEDVTDRRTREEKLVVTSARLTTLVEHLQAAVLVEDDRHRAVLANRTFCETFGLPFTPDQLEGWAIPVVIDATRDRFADPVAFADGVEALITGGTAVVGEELAFADGRVFERDYLPIRRDGDGRGHLWVYRDVTARVRSADELRAARDAAEAANHAKSQFLATMSHEIRTPMNGVTVAAGLLLDTNLSAEQREWASAIRSQGDHLLAIINDILDFSKIEAGRLELERIEFDLRKTMEDAVEFFAETSAAKGLELVSVVDPDLPTILRGDPSRLRQVVVNFLSNAVKFTESGEVVVRVTREDGPRDGAVAVRFAVRDSGIGIPQDALGRLFQPFTQADGTMARRYGGTGLGLAICRQLAELMGGTVGVTSAPGQGSTFWFTGHFEVAPGAMVPSETPPHPAFRDVRVLVVDDNAAQRDVLVHELRGWGLDVSAAGTGAAGVAALHAAQAEGRPIRLAIIDETMPTDGFALAHTIKTDEAIAATRLVLLAAPGRRLISGRTVAAGIATYLRKPVRHAELLETLLRLADPKAGPVAPAPREERERGAADAVLEGARILVAEDNFTNARLTTAVLERMGCTVDVAGDGFEVLEATLRADYDVVLMDCQMPGLDGFEATRRIRDREALGGTPRMRIVAMTANAMTGDRERCLDAGMDDYLAKPIRSDELRDALRRSLDGDAGSPASASRAAVVPMPSAGPDVPLVSPPKMAELRELDLVGAKLLDLVSLFAREASQLLAQAEDALDHHDAAGLDRAAHTLKGSAGNIGASRLALQADRLVAIARAHDLAAARPAVASLRALIDPTLDELRLVARSGLVEADPATEGIAS